MHNFYKIKKIIKDNNLVAKFIKFFNFLKKKYLTIKNVVIQKN